ncbi:MAG: CRTAC1 family protein [Terriglobia bacterium]
MFDSLARELPEHRPAVTFEDVAGRSGIVFVHSRGERTSMLPEDMGSGAAWGDYNNDGFPDLYLVNQTGPLADFVRSPPADAPGNRLYRNNGDGTFTDVTAAAGVGYRGFGMGAFWGDYNNDGCLDLYVTNYGKSLLYRNNCDATFADVTDGAGVGNHGWATGATWFDYNRDGWLDLYVCNYVDFDPEALPGDQTSLQYGINVPFTLNPASFAPQPNRLYRNNRDGTFADVTAAAGVADAQGRSLVVVAADFDLDGWPDLYVGNDISANSLFRNLGDGRFADVSASSATEEYRGTMGIALADFDGDGDLDFFLTHWVAQANALYQNLYNELGSGRPQSLFFADSADLVGVGSISMNDVSWGTQFLDFDNDGRLDLFVVNGSTLEDPANRKLLQPQPPRLLWSQGESGFYDLAPVSGSVLLRPWNGRGLAAADYDNDGDLDFLVTTNRGPVLLLRNDGGARHHWLRVRLRGTKSNRQGIGAQVRLQAGDLRLFAEMQLGGSYLSQHFHELHFGLGERTRIDRLEVLWPSGVRQEFQNLPANQLVEIVEGGPQAGLRPLTLPLGR